MGDFCRFLLLARSTENLESAGDPHSRSVGTATSVKTKMSKRLSSVKGHFPKLVDCAHFHYENVDFGAIQLQFESEQSNSGIEATSAKDLVFLVQVSCQGKSWMVRRTYEEFRTLDSHLHLCIYDRRYSQLNELPPVNEILERNEFSLLLSDYLKRLSMIIDNKLNCGPVLTWMEIDNRGNRFLLKEEASLNVPAIAAAHVIKRYTAQASDELSIEVGNILSVIDMPPKEDTSWWRGKHGFQVGFFPSECVELINEKLSQAVNAAGLKQDLESAGSKTGAVAVTGSISPSSVSKKHGKLIGFLRTFMKSRPSKQKLKQRGILKERVFGCDLGEHLLNSGHEVPQVLRSCSEFIEKHGIVDGIYRHSGISSNIQKLRHEFDSEIIPELTNDVYMQDIHCVGSLCKLYFRELPNPLLTYQLYDKFADSMSVSTEEERLIKIHDVIQQLPPPHYRTLEFLLKHLSQLALCCSKTNMHIKNLAIVWAPNLLRSKEIESIGLCGTDAFKEVRVQSVVVEFLLNHVEILFSDSFTSVGKSTTAGQPSLTRPKSFMVSSLSTRLLSLEEAQARTQASLLCADQSGILGLREGPVCFQGKYHTVLDMPPERRKSGMKLRKSGGGSWKAFFAIGKQGGRKPTRVRSLFQSSRTETGSGIETVTLRSARSEESLCSQHSTAGLSRLHRLRRPRSSSDALSITMETEVSSLKHCRSYDSVHIEDPEGIYMLPDFSNEASLWMTEDEMDFSPTYSDENGLDLNPPPYHLGFQRPVTEDPDSLLNHSEILVRKGSTALHSQRAQSYCQHRTSSVVKALPQGSDVTSPIHEKPGKSTSFTKKVVHALSPKGTKSLPMDISDPVAISVPAKVLEMIGGRAGEFQSACAPPQQPQMISMLLKSCDIQLTESCQQEIKNKLSFDSGKFKGQSLHSYLSDHSHTADRPPLQAGLLPSLSLNHQVPPPPPPKNPARLMALALTESANKAIKQNRGATGLRENRPADSGSSGIPLETQFMRSVSVDSSDCPPSATNAIYSTVRPLSVWKPEKVSQASHEKETVDGQQLSPSHRVQEIGAISSQTSLSDSAASGSEVSTSSSSGETDSRPLHKPQQLTIPYVMASAACQPQDKPPDVLNPHSASIAGEAQMDATKQFLIRKKVPTYTRQYSAPHLHSKHPVPPPKPANLQRFQHSKSESTPAVHSSASLKEFQPTRPKLPPKPTDIMITQCLPSRGESYSKKSLDLKKSRMLHTSQSTQPPPFLRNDSDKICHVKPKSQINSDHQSGNLGTYVQGYEDRSINNPNPEIMANQSENFYYEIASEPQFPPDHRYVHQNAENQMRFDGGSNHPIRSGHEHVMADRHLRNFSLSVRPHLWTGIQSNMKFNMEQSPSGQAGASGYLRSAGPHYSNTPHDHVPQQFSGPLRMVPMSRTEVPPNQDPVAYQRKLYRMQGSTPTDIGASQLHPYFENGKVCYRYFDSGATVESSSRIQQDIQTPVPRTRTSVIPTKPLSSQENQEPIYVNFPFKSGKTWTTTNLDGDHQNPHSDPTPPEGPSERPSTNISPDLDENNLERESISQSAGSFQGASRPVISQYDNMSASVGQEMVGPEVIHVRSRSDPGSTRAESPKDVDNGKKDLVSPTDVAVVHHSICPLPAPELPSTAQPQRKSGIDMCSKENSKQQWEGMPLAPRNILGLHPEALRRSSTSGGHYRQSFDVMPSGDQILKFYRAAQQFITHSPPVFVPHSSLDEHNSYYCTRQQDISAKPAYSKQFQVSMSAHDPNFSVPPTNLAHLSLTMSGSPQVPQAQIGYSPGGFPVIAGHYSSYQLQSPSFPFSNHQGNVHRRDVIVPALDPTFRPSHRSQAGIVRQGSLPAANWTVHTEGQTRSYC
ncbi:rho GTPase-activating protein 32 isoform X2 [Polypterus senegalus]|uniref:rho GTPase-activating protein 32 isoform X2 n=1 Tax=Polypterus senegalus TaxID=55291 RepID=UPI001964F1B8|nr:rho GTPase-activating protein 32 isoform X2 [Polypterus senegalus]